MVKKQIVTNISHKFTEEDWRSIRAFNKRAEDLLKAEIVIKEKSVVHANLKWKQEEGMTFTVTLPHEDLVKSFLMSFRFFYLKNEPSNFLKIANLVKRCSDNYEVDFYISRLKKRWSGLLEENPVWSVNGKELTTDKLLDLWFNAHYFHSDEIKERELADLNTIFPTEFSKSLFLSAVYEATHAVLKLYEGTKGLVN